MRYIQYKNFLADNLIFIILCISLSTLFICISTQFILNDVPCRLCWLQRFSYFNIIVICLSIIYLGRFSLSHFICLFISVQLILPSIIQQPFFHGLRIYLKKLDNNYGGAIKFFGIPLWIYDFLIYLILNSLLLLYFRVQQQKCYKIRVKLLLLFIATFIIITNMYIFLHQYGYSLFLQPQVNF